MDDEERRKRLSQIIFAFSERDKIGWEERDWKKNTHMLISTKQVEVEGEKVNILRITVKNTFWVREKIKDILKKHGFKYDGKNHVWHYEGIMEEAEFRQLIYELQPYLKGIFVDDKIVSKVMNTLGVAPHEEGFRVEAPVRKAERQPPKQVEAPQEKMPEPPAPEMDIPEPSENFEEEIPEPEEAFEEAPEPKEKVELEIPEVKGAGIDTRAVGTKKKESEFLQQGNFAFRYITFNKTAEEIKNEINTALEKLDKFIEGHLAYVYLRSKYTHIIVDKAYDKRAELEKLGYRYNPEAKTFEKFLDRDKDVQKEINRLSQIGVDKVVPIGASFKIAEQNMKHSRGMER